MYTCPEQAVHSGKHKLREERKEGRKERKKIMGKEGYRKKERNACGRVGKEKKKGHIFLFLKQILYF